jgi:uncharacterized protein (DUF1800 family)
MERGLSIIASESAMPRIITSNPSVRAQNRFGLGAVSGARIDDPRGWLKAQLDGPAPKLDVADLPGPEAGDQLQIRLRTLQQERDPQAIRQVRQQLNQIGQAEASRAFRERVVSTRPFVERLVAFWSNHLCVAIPAKPLRLSPLAGRYEREVIRPHVLGRFEDMVRASARHPAMLAYLDNAQSIGPNSQIGRQAERRNVTRGLNENYARELLELHTLGVDGGYTEDDVRELARIFTGWSIGDANPPRPAPAGGNTFMFRPAAHEPGSKTVLGVRYSESGVGEGDSVIRDLCRHRSTARLLALKLVRHFVSDVPPPSAVDRVAGVYQDTDGDLAAVARALVDVEAAWDRDTAKFRTPQDWLVAVVRAVGSDGVPPGLINTLGQLRQPLWSPSSPKGYPDTTTAWADPDALMNRAELARSLAGRLARRIRQPETLIDLMETDPASPLHMLLSDMTIDVGERVALAVGGPDFQWR